MTNNARRESAAATTTSSMMMRNISTWNCPTVSLRDFVRLHPTPTVVRFVHTSSRRSPTSASQHPDDDKLLYIHSVSPVTVAVADGLHPESIGSSRLAATGRVYSIPVDFRGWFELLSQDGHAVAPIASVRQLIDADPQRCLVRQSIVGLSEDAAGLVKVAIGETLTLLGTVTVQRDGPSRRQLLLKCRVDRSRECVLLSPDQRALFSPVAGPTSVVGVHRIRSVVSKFRFPVVVRLIDGVSGAGGTAFRVVGLRAVDTAHILPMWLVKAPASVSRSMLLALPTTADVSAVINSKLSSSTDGQRELDCVSWTDSDWKQLQHVCDDLIASHPIVGICQLVDRHQLSRDSSLSPLKTPPDPYRSSVRQPSVEEERLLTEIDDIYDTIRNGGGGGMARRQTATAAPARGHHQPVTSNSLPQRELTTGRSTADRANRTAISSHQTTVMSNTLSSPARRSHTLDPSYLKPDRFTTARVQSRSPVAAPGTLHRVASARTTTTTQHACRLHDSSASHSPLIAAYSNEPVYEDLRPLVAAEFQTVSSSQPTESKSKKTDKPTEAELSKIAEQDAHLPHDEGKYVALCNIKAHNSRNATQADANVGGTSCRNVDGHHSRPRSFSGTDATLQGDQPLNPHQQLSQTGPPTLPIRRLNSDMIHVSRSHSARCAGDHNFSAMSVSERPSSADGCSQSPPGVSSPLSSLGSMSRSFVRSIRRAGSHSSSRTLVLNAPSSESSGRNFGCRIIVDDGGRHQSWRTPSESGLSPGSLSVVPAVGSSHHQAAFGCKGMFTKVSQF